MPITACRPRLRLLDTVFDDYSADTSLVVTAVSQKEFATNDMKGFSHLSCIWQTPWLIRCFCSVTVVVCYRRIVLWIARRRHRRCTVRRETRNRRGRWDGCFTG